MFYKILWNYWKKFGRILGKIQTTLILSVIYYLIVTPTGLIKRFFSPKKKLTTYWLDVSKQDHSLKNAYEQY